MLQNLPNTSGNGKCFHHNENQNQNQSYFIDLQGEIAFRYNNSSYSKCTSVQKQRANVGNKNTSISVKKI